MIYLHRDIDVSEKTKWGREVKIKTVRLVCEALSKYDKEDIFIKVGKSKYFPAKGGTTIRVLKTSVINEEKGGF